MTLSEKGPSEKDWDWKARRRRREGGLGRRTSFFPSLILYYSSSFSPFCLEAKLGKKRKKEFPSFVVLSQLLRLDYDDVQGLVDAGVVLISIRLAD